MTDETQPTTRLPHMDETRLNPIEPPPDMSGFKMTEIREGAPRPAPDTSSYRMEQIREGAPPREGRVKPRRAATDPWDVAFVVFLASIFVLQMLQLGILLYWDW